MMDAERDKKGPPRARLESSRRRQMNLHRFMSNPVGGAGGGVSLIVISSNSMMITLHCDVLQNKPEMFTFLIFTHHESLLRHFPLSLPLFAFPKTISCCILTFLFRAHSLTLGNIDCPKWAIIRPNHQSSRFPILPESIVCYPFLERERKISSSSLLELDKLIQTIFLKYFPKPSFSITLNVIFLNK